MTALEITWPLHRAHYLCVSDPDVPPDGRPARTTASDGGMKVSIGRHVHECPADPAFRAEK